MRWKDKQRIKNTHYLFLKVLSPKKYIMQNETLSPKIYSIYILPQILRNTTSATVQWSLRFPYEQHPLGWHCVTLNAAISKEINH
jgi:hypothetical protein